MRSGSPRRPLAALVAALLLAGAAPALPTAAGGPVRIVARDVTTSVDATRLVALPIRASHVAVHWRGAVDADVTIALSGDGVVFARPMRVERDEVGEARGNGETYGAVVAADGARFARLTTDRPIARLTVLAIASSAPPQQGFGATAAAAMSQPAVIARSGWGADESLRFDAAGNERWIPAFYPVQKLVVHHTAGTNDDPDPAATIRAIYYYHAITQGWGDIGYNFLIDEAGRVYEGRYSRPYASGESPTGEDAAGNGVTGAHVQGYNSGTVGVALLGALTSVDATPAARDAVERLLAWKADRHAIDPHGESLYTNPVNGTQKVFANIAGHRDLAATECPGGTFYGTLPALRSAVATRIGGGGGSTATVPGAPTLTATQPKRGKGVDLAWTVPSDGGSAITSYRIERATGSGPPILLATVVGTATTYRDGSPRRGTTYSYTVTALNAVGAGPASNRATITVR